jgi:cytochrome bd ubiquinol oxidase subunit I
LYFYPIQDHGPLIKGIVAGGLGIFHLFLVEMAIGGGMLLCYFELLRRGGRSRYAGRFINGYFQALVLVCAVLGGLTGVAWWFTAIQVSPRTIGAMIVELQWIWATEWSFLCVEVVSGYAFLRYKDRLSARGRLTLLVVFSTAAWFSLFWMSGISSFQVAPGRSAETNSIWAGFFNPSFWPLLLYRTVAATSIAALAACVLINASGTDDREARRALIENTSLFLAPMMLIPFLGGWFLASMPADSRSEAMGGSVTVTMLMGIGAIGSALIGAYALGALWYRRLSASSSITVFLCALAFAAALGGEFVHEGVRKPDSLGQALYVHSLRQDDLDRLRTVGSVAEDPYPLQDGLRYANDQLPTGAKVFRFQCSVCHTYDGANGLLELTGTWTVDQKRHDIAQLQRTKPFMPPFAGTCQELEALVQVLGWRRAGKPSDWPVSDDPATLKEIQAWLDEVGTTPGIELMRGGEASGTSRRTARIPVATPRERR